ncbi:MAG: hypothetical protein AAF215_25655 [Cyanobacteria bacterium P01_A01_bin.123]
MRIKLCSTLLLIMLGMVSGCTNSRDRADCPPADAPDRPQECEGIDGTAPPPGGPGEGEPPPEDREPDDGG